MVIGEGLRRGFAGAPDAMTGVAADAAVLIAIQEGPEPAVLLTVKAPHLRTHAGEVALPGGRVEAADASVTDTALREAWEETGLPPASVEILGTMEPARSKHGLLVVPSVGLVHERPSLAPRDTEIAEIFFWPLRELLEDRRVGMDTLERPGEWLHVPAYEWQGQRIWGLTAQLLIRLANAHLGTAIEMRLEPRSD